MKLELYRQIFEKFSNTKFNENLFDGILVFKRTAGRTADRQTEMTKLIVPFRHFVNCHKKNDYL